MCTEKLPPPFLHSVLLTPHHHPHGKTTRRISPQEPVSPRRVEAEEQLKFMGRKERTCVLVSVLCLLCRDAADRGRHEERCQPPTVPFTKEEDPVAPKLSCGTTSMITVESTVTIIRNMRGIISTMITSIFLNNVFHA